MTQCDTCAKGDRSPVLPLHEGRDLGLVVTWPPAGTRETCGERLSKAAKALAGPKPAAQPGQAARASPLPDPVPQAGISQQVSTKPSPPTLKVKASSRGQSALQ